MPFNLEDFFDNISGFIPVLIIIGGAILSLFSKQEKKKTGTNNKQAPKKNPVESLQTRMEKWRQPVSSGTFKAGEAKSKQTAQKVVQADTPKARDVYHEEAERRQKVSKTPVVVSEPKPKKRAKNALNGLDLKRAMVMKEVLDKPVALRKK